MLSSRARVYARACIRAITKFALINSINCNSKNIISSPALRTMPTAVVTRNTPYTKSRSQLKVHVSRRLLFGPTECLDAGAGD